LLKNQQSGAVMQHACIIVLAAVRYAFGFFMQPDSLTAVVAAGYFNTVHFQQVEKFSVPGKANAFVGHEDHNGLACSARGLYDTSDMVKIFILRYHDSQYFCCHVFTSLHRI
jgi:hypothetical protein